MATLFSLENGQLAADALTMKGAWEHFTSWWAYQAMAGVSLLLLSLLIATGSDLFYVLFRLMVPIGAVAYAYDQRSRRPKLKSKKTKARKV